MISTRASVTADARCYCGGNHLPQDHWEFLESMPQNPADWMSDLVKMGVYKPEAVDLANTLIQVEMREALLLKNIANGDPHSGRVSLAHADKGDSACYGSLQYVFQCPSIYSQCFQNLLWQTRLVQSSHPQGNPLPMSYRVG